MTYSSEEKKNAVERELSFRRRVYSRQVSDGRMSKEMATHQIAIFEAIRDDYAQAEETERLI
jgi:hypothetical protein